MIIICGMLQCIVECNSFFVSSVLRVNCIQMYTPAAWSSQQLYDRPGTMQAPCSPFSNKMYLRHNSNTRIQRINIGSSDPTLALLGPRLRSRVTLRVIRVRAQGLLGLQQGYRGLRKKYNYFEVRKTIYWYPSSAGGTGIPYIIPRGTSRPRDIISTDNCYTT